MNKYDYDFSDKYIWDKWFKENGAPVGTKWIDWIRKLTPEQNKFLDQYRQWRCDQDNPVRSIYELSR